MIKYFRKIRENLLSKGKTAKYFKYAIGEIILVVIGILIALQINNWNEVRKQKNKEIALLQELKNNLNDTKSAIDTSLTWNKKNLEWNSYLLDVINNNALYDKKLDTIFGHLPYWDTPFLTENAYQNIKTLGVEIISDTLLRKHTVELYEETLPKLLNDWDKWEWNINQTIVMPFFSKHIRGNMKDRRIATPNDFEALKKNEEFQNILSVIYRTRIYGIVLMEESLVKLEEASIEIDKFLDND